MSAREPAVERLAAYIASADFDYSDNPHDGSSLRAWLDRETQRHARLLAQYPGTVREVEQSRLLADLLIRDLGLVAVDPALVEAAREAGPARLVDGTDCWDGIYARLALADSILAQLGDVTRRPAPG